MSAATSQHQPARLKFTDHLMFNAVLTENEDLCRTLIGEVLGKHVESIEYLNDEVTFQPDIDGHGARLDVLALIDGEYVDVEMQAGREPSIARRCRFYHGAIASRHTPKGSDYKGVPNSYVIFICLNDPLGEGLPRYELCTCCTNCPATDVDDGAFSVLLNARAWEQEKNPEVAGMLNYALTGHFDGGLAESLAKAVDDKNLDRKWVKASMGVMSYEHEIRVLNHELEDVNSALEDKRAELKGLQAKLKDAQSELAEAKSELQDAQSELQDTQSKLEETQSELRDTQSELQDTRSELKDTQSELKNVRSSLEATNARVDELTNLLKGLISEGQVSASSLGDPDLMKHLLAGNEEVGQN